MASIKQRSLFAIMKDWSILIQNLPISGDVQSFVQCTVNIIGTGAFVMDASPSSPTADENVDSDFWSATAGQNFVTGLSFYGKTLQGKTILAIHDGGFDAIKY